MPQGISDLELIGHRCEIIAELFLEDLKPCYLVQPEDRQLGFDLVVGFKNSKGGINHYFVEIKAAKKSSRGRFPLSSHELLKLANSNAYVLLLVVDPVHQNIQYGTIAPYSATSGENGKQIELRLEDATMALIDELRRVPER